MSHSTTAKERLIATATEEYERRCSGGVSDQMNASHLLSVIDCLNGLNMAQAHQLERAISAAEDASRKAAAKYGWLPTTISPMDYCAFLPEGAA